MFIKTLKYDFLFSRAAFLAMAGAIIGLASILRVTGLVDGGDVTGIAGLILMIVILVIGLAAVVQILQFYYKNFFDDTGYLMLTLPVKRFKLLVSKLVVSVVWFNFMLLVSVIVAFLIAFTPSPENPLRFRSIIDAINLTNIMTLVEINIMALFFITALFFLITFAFSVVGRWSVHMIVSVAVTFSYAGLFFWLHMIFSQRHREWVTVEREWVTPIFNEQGARIGEQITYGTTSFYGAIVGTNIGRIPIGDMGAYFDIYRWGMSLAFCIVAFIATYYLLNKRASLR